MMLLTDELRQTLPPLYACEQEPDPMIQAKFFTPWTYWTSYVLEFNGVDTFFGWVKGHDAELGYFSLRELENVRGPAGLTIERDLYFEPVPLSKVNVERTKRLSE